MRKLQCPNCHTSPVYSFDSDINDSEFKHMLYHIGNNCPYKYETHQKTENESIKDWNKYIKELKKKLGW